MPKDSSDILQPDTEGARDQEKPDVQSAPARGHADRDLTIAELIEAVQAREDFIAFAAHELRNPITPIQLCVRLIRAAEQSGDHSQVMAELSRLERLLNRFLRRAEVLLDVTQLISGKFRLERTENCLSDLARAVIDDHQGLVARSGSQMSIDLAPDVVAFVDGVAFTQIVETCFQTP
jgi:two-component system OmpR family sensor kinase